MTMAHYYIMCVGVGVDILACPGGLFVVRVVAAVRLIVVYCAVMLHALVVLAVVRGTPAKAEGKAKAWNNEMAEKETADAAFEDGIYEPHAKALTVQRVAMSQQKSLAI